ncbi:hypothetical protein GR925_14550 [Streptomyces sp. HUCO-GS316]|nr:hypothetical protein [Streptomyces sp. HUCO-GS316]
MRATDVLAYVECPGTSNGPTEAINGRREHLRGSRPAGNRSSHRRYHSAHSPVRSSQESIRSACPAVTGGGRGAPDDVYRTRNQRTHRTSFLRGAARTGPGTATAAGAAPNP